MYSEDVTTNSVEFGDSVQFIKKFRGIPGFRLNLKMKNTAKLGVIKIFSHILSPAKIGKPLMISEKYQLFL
jgi:hypothetical protein